VSRSRNKRKLKLITIPGVVLALALGWVAAHFFPAQRALPVRRHDDHFFKVVNKPVAASEPQPFGHPYFRYSIIPGGAYTLDELKAALARDPVAAAHYSDFDLGKAHLITLDSDKQFYVSYRIADKIYWTKRLITLHKGEQVITDGVHFARVRCGNRLSLKPSAPVVIEMDPTEQTMGPVQIATGWLPTPPALFEPPAGPDIPMEIAYSRMPLGPSGPVPGGPHTQTGASTPNETGADSAPAQPSFAFDGPHPVALSPAFLASQAAPVSGFFPPGAADETPPVSGVPEPGTAALGGFSLIALALLSRKLAKLEV
jgi:hypothetical protein